MKEVSVLDVREKILHIPGKMKEGERKFKFKMIIGRKTLHKYSKGKPNTHSGRDLEPYPHIVPGVNRTGVLSRWNAREGKIPLRQPDHQVMVSQPM